jgi:ABC-2 type transport system permease protein
MKAVYLKEMRGYFNGITGFLIICLFLLVCGLFVFAFDGPYNILNYGFADLSPFFLLLPWLFIILIPASTMRTFTMERELGTLEMLVTRPVSIYSIVGGKSLAAFTLTLLALLPSLLYVFTVGTLGVEYFNLDLGSTAGGYLGAIMLAMVYTSISIFCSTLVKNQIIALLLAALLCFGFYFGFESLSEYVTTDDFVPSLGIKYHYESIARGVLDTRDIVYFISLSLFFFALSVISLKISLDRD